MSVYLLVGNGVLGAVAMGWFRQLRKYQQRLYINEGRKLGWPIPSVRLSEFDDAFRTAAHGPISAGAT